MKPFQVVFAILSLIAGTTIIILTVVHLLDSRMLCSPEHYNCTRFRIRAIDREIIIRPGDEFPKVGAQLECLRYEPAEEINGL
jgi:hypothetical protein